jgi:NAD(P)-dependent dehydrogenase (short-subunit alcohol dehydrogenase family)
MAERIDTSIGIAGRRALVTGGGSGIGRATAVRLAASGAEVVVAGRRREALEETAGLDPDGRIAVAPMDLTDADSIAAALAEGGGPFDILVNSAAIYESHDLLEMTDEDWNRTIQTNLVGLMLVSRAVATDMVERGSGSIVNVSSVSAFVGDRSDRVAHYCASKGGVIGYTRQAAIELADKGVRVNAVLPGTIDTDMLEEWKEDSAGLAAWTAANVPMNRVGRPEEVAAVCHFLSSADAACITGSLFVVDGGMLDL